MVRGWALTSREGSPISRWNMLQQIWECSHTGWGSFLPIQNPSVGISIVLSTVFIYIGVPLAFVPRFHKHYGRFCFSLIADGLDLKSGSAASLLLVKPPKYPQFCCRSVRPPHRAHLNLWKASTVADSDTAQYRNRWFEDGSASAMIPYSAAAALFTIPPASFPNPWVDTLFQGGTRTAILHRAVQCRRAEPCGADSYERLHEEYKHSKVRKAS